jgi:excisionase family DNA binding protein
MTKSTENNKELPELLTLKEACDILKCHPNTLRQWDNKGILVAVRFGERKDRRYRKEDILKLFTTKKNS